MAYDLVIRNGRIIDGSGMPSFHGDVAVQDGKIVDVGRFSGDAKQVINAGGLAVSPGFIDNHTHFDAQVLWDPLCTSSCWHGVTSVVMGNCGLALAPTQPQDGDTLLRMLSRIEAIPIDALRHGVEFRWNTIGEYLRTVEQRLGVNVASLIGHSAVRQYVLGDEASERQATPDEIAAMQDVVRDGMRAGALGFTTNQNPNHINDEGKPVPSVVAPDDEILALGEVLSEFGSGVIQTSGAGTDRMTPNFELSKQLAQRSGRPVVWLSIQHRWSQPNAWREQLQMAEKAFQEGFRAYPLSSPRRNNTRFTLKNAQIFDGLPSWRPIMLQSPEEKLAAFANPEVRKQLWHDAVESTIATTFSRRWDMLFVAQPQLAHNQALKGKSIAEIAAAQGKNVLDAFLDLALEEKLETGFEINQINGDDEAVAEILRNPHTLIGLSDAGAHVVFDAGYGFCTRFLGYWVRERQIMPLEEAVRKLTFMSASVFGLYDRGLLRPGLAADITIFDPDTVAACDPQVVYDLPGGGQRLMQHADGIHYTIVNGSVLTQNGEHTGAYPGRLLRNATVQT